MKYKILFFIIVLASVLRLWQLGNIPPSPDWDEASLGYNAYSIMQTGKDEYRQSFPLILRSFDDYKPGLYTYLMIPFIKLFGLEVFAVRLPSAIFGILTVIATYFLVKELFKKSSIALVASLLLAISPWHIQFSRIAFEANVGMAFNVFIIVFFLKGLRQPWYLLFAAVFAGLNIHMYQGEKVFVPIVTLLLAIILRKDLLRIPKKYLATAIIVSFVLILPLLLYLLTEKQVFLRARGVSVFSDQTPFLARTVERLKADNAAKDVMGLVLDNRRITYFVAIVSGYISHFDLNWLFITGDEARHHAPNMGLLYLWELPFLLLGVYQLVFGKFDKKTKLVLLGWFLITPIPAMITTGVPHAVRTLNFLPTFQVFTAIGIIFAMQKISNIQIRYPIYILIFSFSIFNFLYYLNQYFIQQNYFNSQDWQYGYKQAVDFVNNQDIYSKYDKIIVTNKPHLDQSYMFFLFYTQYDPRKYQVEGGTASGGFAEPHRGFAKYTFRPISWEKEEKNSKILYIGRPGDFPDSAKVIKIINFLNGKPAIKIVEG